MTRLLYSAAIAALLSAPAAAQITDFESAEIVTVGTRLDGLTLAELSSPASVLTETDIAARNTLYIADLLRSLPGISVNSSGSAGQLTQIRMRGAEASHTLVLIDGIEVANPNSGEFDFAGLRASDIVRIEVLRGEQSALYGSDAIGGVISITTRAGNSQTGYSVSVEAGSFDTAEGQISAVIPVGEARLSVNGNLFTTEGYDISGTGGNKDGSDSRNINVGLNNVILGAVEVSGKYNAGQTRTEFDSDSPFDGRLDDTDSESIVDTHSARLDARFDLIGFTNRLTVSLSDTQTDSRGGFANISQGSRETLNWTANRSFGDHHITLLAETETEDYSISPSFAVNPTAPSNKNDAFAVDYRYSNGLWNASISARQDINDRFDDATTWRLGGGYNFEDFGGRLRASIGTGVKNPSLIELFGFYPESNFVGNPDLKPETSLGYNIGYTQDFSNGEFSVDYFKSELEDEIFTDFSGFPFLPRNRATDSQREGVELSGRWNPASNVSLRGSVTHIQSDENGVEEVRRPELTGSANLLWNASEAISVNMSVDYTGEQKDTDFATFSVVELDAFTLVGLNAAYAVNEIIALSVRGENLFDEDYQEVVGYRSKGRGLYFGLTANFQ